MADCTFHKMATTWWLSSSTDVKELIPELFYLPEFLLNSKSKYRHDWSPEHVFFQGVLIDISVQCICCNIYIHVYSSE